MLMKLGINESLANFAQRFLLEAQILSVSGKLSPHDASICIQRALEGHWDLFFALSLELSSGAGPEALARKLQTINIISKSNPLPESNNCNSNNRHNNQGQNGQENNRDSQSNWHQEVHITEKVVRKNTQRLILA